MTNNIGEWTENTNPLVMYPALAKINPTAWASTLLDNLTDEDFGIRGQAVIAIALWQKDNDDFPLNLDTFEENLWHSIRHSLASHTPEGAIKRWAKFSPLVFQVSQAPIFVPKIINLLLADDTEEELSEAILRLLSTLDSNFTLGIVRNLVNHPSARLRSLAVEYFGLIGDPDHIDFLRDILLTPDQGIDILFRAAEAIGIISGERSIAALKIVVESASPDAALAAITTLRLHNNFVDNFQGYLEEVLLVRQKDEFLSRAIQNILSELSQARISSVSIVEDAPDPTEEVQTRLPSVLIVEDTTELAEVIQATLERMNIITAHETHGGKAIARFDEMHPDVVLLDIGLPDMTGWKLLEAIKEKHKGEMPIIIMITAYGDPANRLVAKFQGVYNYLIKPFTDNEVKQVVEAALRSRTL